MTTTASCSWTAAPSDNWISITTNGSGIGYAEVTFTVAANPNTTARAGTITAGGQTFTISQDAGSGNNGAVLTLSTNQINVDTGSGGGNCLVYNTGSGTLTWTASTSTPWLTLNTTSGTASSNGTPLSFTYQQNTGSSQRTGTVTVSSPGASGSPQTISVVQAGANGASVNITDIFTPSSANAGSSVTVSWNQTSSTAQYVLSEATLYPTGQTAVKYDIKIDYLKLYVYAGSSQAGTSFDFPANMYSGIYDVEVSLWADSNNDGLIDAGDTLIGIHKKVGVITVNGVPPPTPTPTPTPIPSPSPALHLSTNAINVGSDSGGANLLISNLGGGTLNWSASTADAWITLNTPSGVNAPGAEKSFSFSFQQNTTTAARSALINVIAPGATGGPQSILEGVMHFDERWS